MNLGSIVCHSTVDSGQDAMARSELEEFGSWHQRWSIFFAHELAQRVSQHRHKHKWLSSCQDIKNITLQIFPTSSNKQRKTSPQPWRTPRADGMLSHFWTMDRISNIPTIMLLELLDPCTCDAEAQLHWYSRVHRALRKREARECRFANEFRYK